MIKQRNYFSPIYTTIQSIHFKLKHVILESKGRCLEVYIHNERPARWLYSTNWNASHNHR